MTRGPAIAAALLTLAAPLAAEELVTGPEFEAMTTGRTLTYSRDGGIFGAEQYLPGRQVIWKYADGSCAYGEWYAEGPALCFTYDNDPRPQCWVFSRRDGEFYARVQGLEAGDPSELRMSDSSTAPLGCEGPDLGV